MLAIDHVILGVTDLESSAARILAEHGLASVAGGRHAGLGTANRVVPTGAHRGITRFRGESRARPGSSIPRTPSADYLELLAVVDPVEAAGNPLGQLLGNLAEDRFVGWMVQTDDLDGVAQRLGASPSPMSRELPDGTVLRWRLVFAPPGSPLPGFIQWDIPDGAHPGRAVAAHSVVPTGISELVLGGDQGELESWLGAHELPVTFAGEASGVRAVRIGTTTGDDIAIG